MPPLWAPMLALPPPVSLIPRFLPAAPLLRLAVADRVPEPEREPAPERLVGVAEVSPAVSSISKPSPPRQPMPSVHSPIWSLRLLSCWLIALRLDHRKRPAAAAPAAAAAAAIGRSRAISITPQSLYELRLSGLFFFPPRRLLLGIAYSSLKLLRSQ